MHVLNKSHKSVAQTGQEVQEEYTGNNLKTLKTFIHSCFIHSPIVSLFFFSAPSFVSLSLFLIHRSHRIFRWGGYVGGHPRGHNFFSKETHTEFLHWRGMWNGAEVRLLVSSLTNGIMTVTTSSPRVVGINTKWTSAFTKVPGTKQAVNELEQVYLEVLLCALHNPNACPPLVKPKPLPPKQCMPLFGSSNHYSFSLLWAKRTVASTYYPLLGYRIEPLNAKPTFQRTSDSCHVLCSPFTPA